MEVGKPEDVAASEAFVSNPPEQERHYCDFCLCVDVYLSLYIGTCCMMKGGRSPSERLTRVHTKRVLVSPTLQKHAVIHVTGSTFFLLVPMATYLTNQHRHPNPKPYATIWNPPAWRGSYIYVSVIHLIQRICAADDLRVRIISVCVFVLTISGRAARSH